MLTGFLKVRVLGVLDQLYNCIGLLQVSVLFSVQRRCSGLWDSGSGIGVRFSLPTISLHRATCFEYSACCLFFQLSPFLTSLRTSLFIMC